MSNVITVLSALSLKKNIQMIENIFETQFKFITGVKSSKSTVLNCGVCNASVSAGSVRLHCGRRRGKPQERWRRVSTLTDTLPNILCSVGAVDTPRDGC